MRAGGAGTGLFRAGTTAGPFSVLATSAAGGTGVATVLVDPWIGVYRGSYKEFFPTIRLGIATIQLTRFLSPRAECPLNGIACSGIARFDADESIGQCFFQPLSNGVATVHGSSAARATFGGGELNGAIETGSSTGRCSARCRESWSSHGSSGWDCRCPSAGRLSRVSSSARRS